MKSDKLALTEGKILNLMFLISIPVVPVKNWLRATHNQRQKNPKVASVLLFRHILKTTSWLECGSSLLNSRMWPGIDPGGDTLGISGWGSAAGTLEPLTYTRASLAEFCYPILE